MRKPLFFSTILIVLLIVSSCSNSSVKKIKADYFDIGFGQSLYSGYDKVEKETVQSLVDAYNDIKYIGQTNQQINYEKAITITFIYNDQISGTLVIDDKGIFSLRDSLENYQIEPNNNIYKQGKEIYNDLKMDTIKQLDLKLNEIVSSPEYKLSSNPNDYLKARSQEFDYIVSKKEITLNHFLDQFAKNQENGLKEYIMAIACVEILGKKNPVKEWSSGREWYEKFSENQ